ncbi:MAG: DDE-type integrase/transposase/recombinase [Candidatus Sulfopaludibacter sp.]|nr:DDE-type integrase/transposase/recombinase [Candidatus Sulfopaludibacter sp.]
MGSLAKTQIKPQRTVISAPSLSTSELTGAPAESLALGLRRAVGLNGSEAAQAEAGAEFRNIIDPILNPERFAELHRAFPRRCDLVQHLAEQHQMSARSIYRRIEAWEQKGITGLLRKIRSDKGSPRALNQASINFIIAYELPKPGVYGEYSNAEIWKIHEEERAWRQAHASKPLSPENRAKYAGCLDTEGRFLPSAQLSQASYATFCRQVDKLPELVKTMARKGQDAYRNHELLSFRDYNSILPLDYVVMDHRVLDIFSMVRDGRNGWKLIRPWLTAALDMRTRRWLAWVIVETPSSDSIAAVLKRVFVNAGLPTAVYWDNGKDFRCQWLEGGQQQNRAAKRIDGLPEKWTGVLESLDIRVTHALAYRARSKVIEPCFGAIADFDRSLPEWCGHKPGARPERFDSLLKDHEDWLKGRRPNTPFRTIEEIAALYDLKLNDLNEQEHRGEGMHKVTPTGYGWKCPNEAWEILIPKVQRRTIPEDVLQLCFAKRRELTIRNGEVQVTFAGKPYHYRLTSSRMGLLGLNGRTVELAYDPLDLGKAAIYHESTFIGLAECLPLRHMGESAFVQDERDRRHARREVNRFIKTVHETVPTSDPETYLLRRQAVRPARLESGRLEVPAQLPAPIADARAAQQAEQAFSFEDATGDIAVSEAAPAVAGDEFNFFSDQGAEA